MSPGANLPSDPAALVLYRDAGVLVIDKPPGLAVHAAPGAGPTLDPLLDQLRFGLKWRPGLAHRLDRDTSGCLVLGRHPQALRALNALFAAGAVEKSYWAIVSPPPEAAEGTIDLALLKVHRGSAWFMATDPGGQNAVTHWRRLGQAGDLAWLELRPVTGRMHQLRAHCAAAGMPILGDPLYGPPSRGTQGPLQLHARAVSFILGKRAIAAEAPPPVAFASPSRALCELVSTRVEATRARVADAAVPGTTSGEGD